MPIEAAEAASVDLAAGTPVTGRSPWRLAGRRLARNRVAMASLVLFLLIVLACLLAPVYAHDVAHTDPFVSNVSGTTIVDGKVTPVLQQAARSSWARRRSVRPGTSTTTSSAPTTRGAT
jgi:peptide/nickel transport system permease protein